MVPPVLLPSSGIGAAAVLEQGERPGGDVLERDQLVSTARRTYQVTAHLTQYKEESDGDVHLVLKGSAGRRLHPVIYIHFD